MMSNITAKAIIFSTLYKISIDNLGEERVSKDDINDLADVCIESSKIIFDKLNFDVYDE